MNARNRLSKIDVIVAVVCLVFLLVNIPVILAGGRERAKQEVCMTNLRVLADAWQMFANDNGGKIPSGDVYYSWSFGHLNGATGPQLAWFEWPHPWPHTMPPSQATNTALLSQPYKEADWQHAIAEGLLWNYVRDYNIYRCPIGQKGEYVTYTMVHSMNTWDYSGGGSSRSQWPPTIRNINQITKPAERLVFLDEGFAKQGAFFVKYSGTNIARWYDLPPMPHEKGTTFAFADGHTTYRKWTDPHAITAAESGIWGGGPDDNCDCDLRWFVKATWGKILYDCTDPNKHCED